MLFATDSCFECGLRAAGRCPTCRHGLCVEHFPLDAHEPCASRLETEMGARVCYRCAAPVTPHQWSAEVYAHYVDTQRCAGCGRYVCAQRHTRVLDEFVRLERDGLRSNRYHTTLRYCALCAPVRRLGGLVGATWWSVSLFIAGCTALFLFRP